MSRTKRYLQRKAVERVPDPVISALGKVVLKAVDAAVEQRWQRAVRVAADADGVTVEDRVTSISKRFRRELTVMGAATGAAAAAPGIGTAAAASALAADLGWFAMRATDLIMAIGAAHGLTTSTVEERRAWVLSVLAFGEEAADQFITLLDELGESSDGGVGTVVSGERVSTRLAGLAGGDAATLDAIRRINASLASKVVTKYGSRRSVLAVGKLLPFGIGAVVGSSANYGMIRVVGSQASRFFDAYQALRPASAGGLLTGQTGGSLPRPPSYPGAKQGDPAAPAPNPDVLTGEAPPPPAPGSARLPNPPARLSKSDRRRSIPARARPKPRD